MSQNTFENPIHFDPMAQDPSVREAVYDTPKLPSAYPKDYKRMLGGIGSSMVEVVHQPSEQLSEQEVQLASDLHTLLVSTPPGQARLDLMGEFPELDEPLSVRDALSFENTGSSERRELLDRLIDKAVQVVGGPDVAQSILQYPGITYDEDLELVRPVPQDWLATSEKANKLAPQNGEVIAVINGHQVFRDISQGRATWEDIAYSYLDKDQIKSQKIMVAKLHDAFRKYPAMPSGHDGPNTTYVIPDARFGHLWRLQTHSLVNMGKSVVSWIEDSEHITAFPAVDETSPAWEVGTIEPSVVTRLDDVFSDPRSKPYVDAMLELYSAAEATIYSDQGKALLKSHRRQLNTKLASASDDDPYADLLELVSHAVKQAAGELGQTSSVTLPHEIAIVFMANLD